MPNSSEFRARWAKQLVAAAKRLPDGAGERVLERIEGEVRTTIREARLLDFVAEPIFLGLCRGIHEGLPAAKHQRYWDLALEIALDSALLQPIVLGAYGIFGRRPSALVRVAPQVWKLLTRAAGRPSVSVHEGLAIAQFDFPQPLADEPGFVAAIGGYAAATLTLTGHEGELHIEHSGTEVRYLVSWIA